MEAQAYLKRNLEIYQKACRLYNASLVVVTKTQPVEVIRQVYNLGQKVFGENRVQELMPKYESLPKDIEWHLIGHLQSNKVKYIAPFIHTIHSVDSLSLLKEINKQAAKHNRVINCLLQLYIASEDTKFGLDEPEALDILHYVAAQPEMNIRITGFMGMATNTDDCSQIEGEFSKLKSFFDRVKSSVKGSNLALENLSMGMSGDYEIALKSGSTMIRIGSAIFKKS